MKSKVLVLGLLALSFNAFSGEFSLKTKVNGNSTFIDIERSESCQSNRSVDCKVSVAQLIPNVSRIKYLTCWEDSTNIVDVWKFNDLDTGAASYSLNYTKSEEVVVSESGNQFYAIGATTSLTYDSKSKMEIFKDDYKPRNLRCDLEKN